MGRENINLGQPNYYDNSHECRVECGKPRAIIIKIYAVF